MKNKLFAEEIVNNFYKKEVTKRSPNSPLLQTPHINIKISCKNFQCCKDFFYFYKTYTKKNLVSRLINLSHIETEKQLELEKNKAFINSPGIYYEAFLVDHNLSQFQIKEYLLDRDETKLKHILQGNKSKTIYHSNPKWLEDNNFSISDGKNDKVLFKFYKTQNDKNDVVEYLGFQMISMIELEKEKSLEGILSLRIVEMTPEKYFCEKALVKIEELEKRSKMSIIEIIKEQSTTKSQNSISTLDNTYIQKNIDSIINLVKEKITFFKSDKYKESQLLTTIPLIIIKYDYKTFGRLWKMSALVHSISQVSQDKKDKKQYYYKFYCKRNDGLNWFKELTFSEISLFRDKVLLNIPYMRNFPFPSKSLLSNIPFIGKFYSDENDDVLIEKKFTIDNFFENLLEREDIYKFDFFNEFFLIN